jgi:GTPase-associated protein 1, N-terminal domain type 1
VSKPVLIHQLFHGYRRGHEQLAASVRLSQADSDVVTRLSDLSGTLLSGFVLKSYLTLYPLPSSKFYAVALTRPDPSAPRTGCVLTHTLLLKMEQWSTVAFPREVSSLFIESAAAPEGPISSLEYEPEVSFEKPQLAQVSLEDEDFVGRYFGEGIRPIVWVDASDPEEKLWAIVTGLWPALRRSFSACTLCLQPRNLQKRPFDLMFSPGVASSRFSRLSADHFITSPPLTGEPWQREFAVQLFGGGYTDPQSKTVNFALDDNPLSIRKVFLFRDLWNRSAEKPTAAIGAFDLLESLHAPETTSRLQSIALRRALSSFDSLLSHEHLELFSMLVLRISRVEANGYKQEELFIDLMDVLVKDVLREFPDSVLSEIERVWPRLKADERFKTGFLTNLAMALPGNQALAVAVAGRPDIGKELIVEHPEAVARALNEPGAALLRDQTLEWLNDPLFRNKLCDFRVRLLGQLRADQDAVLIRKLLLDIEEHEIVPILTALMGSVGLPCENREVREAIIDFIARPFPVQTREWIESSDRRDDVLAEILSVTYQPEITEYRRILIGSELDLGFRHLVFANWIGRNSGHNSRFVCEISNAASNDPLILQSLIKPLHGGVSEKALQIILESMGLIRTLPEQLVGEIFLYRPGDLKLIDITIRSSISSFVLAGENITSLETVLGQGPFATWLDNGKGWRLAGLVRGAVSTPESCSRGWQVIYRLPDPVYGPDPVVTTIESLLDPTARYFSSSAVETWLKIIQRARDTSSDQTFEVELCGQAIRFAFDNPHLPVSSLVVEGFFPLYLFVTEVKRVPSSATSLFSIWNWDKGVELREKLADRFLAGSWPPGDLALAVRDFGLLKKILKRISRRHGGQSFVRRMYSDLVSRNDSESRSLTKSLSGLLRNPDYDEEWD